MLLLSAVILTRTCDTQAEHVAIKLQTRFGVTNNDCRMIDSQKQLVRSMPFRITLAFGKLQDLQPVFVRIAKVKSFDTAGILVPVRQTLWTSRGMLDFV